MTPPAPSRPAAGRPPATSAAEILAAARELIEEHGWQSLTIRTLAARLNVGASTIYHHVRDREDLLVQLLNAQAATVAHESVPTDPRSRIIAGATAMHAALVAAPWAADVLVADDLVGEASLWMVEAIVGGAMDYGKSVEQSVDLYRSLWYYTAGEILVRARAAEADESGARASYRDRVFHGLDRAALPHLATIADEWPAITRRDTYAAGLGAFVDGLLRA